MALHTRFTLENDREVDVFDDLFPLDYRLFLYSVAKNSIFKIGWSDSEVPERKSHDYFLHSVWTADDIEKTGIMTIINETYISQFLEDYQLEKTILNLSTPSDVNYVHTHPEGKVLLYYVNVDWRDGWHGETQFYSENLKHVQYTSPYTPGRLILFDAKIPHAIRPQSIIAPQFRFTLAMCLNKKNKGD